MLAVGRIIRTVLSPFPFDVNKIKKKDDMGK